MSKNLASSTSSSSSEVKQKTKPTTPGNKPTTQPQGGNKPPTTTKTQPKKVESSSSSSSSSKKGKQVKPQTTTKTNPTQTKPQANAPKQNGTNKQPVKKVESSDSSSSSSDVKMTEKGKPNQTQPTTKNANSQGKTTAQGGKNVATQGKNVGGKKVESSDSSSDSSEVKQKGNANTPAKKGTDATANTPKVEVRLQTRLSTSGQIKRDVSPNPNEDTSDSSDSDDKKKKGTTTATQKPTTTAGKTEQTKKKKEGSDSSDSSSEMHIDLNKPKTTNDLKNINKRKRENDEENNAKKRKPNIKGANNGESNGTGNTKVRVANLSFDLDGCDDDIKGQFESCGEIKGVEMIKKNDGRWAGVAILEFADEEGANAAVNMNNTEYCGRKMNVSLATDSQSQRGGPGGPKRTYQVSQKPEGCTTIFIGNLNFNITEDQVFEFFGDCGDIKECRWPKGDFTGIGWVEFYDTNATDLAVKKAGQNVMGRDIRVDYAAPRKNNF